MTDSEVIEAASWLAVFEEKVTRLQQSFRDMVAHHRNRIEALTHERDRARELLVSAESQIASLISQREAAEMTVRMQHNAVQYHSGRAETNEELRRAAEAERDRARAAEEKVKDELAGGIVDRISSELAAEWNAYREGWEAWEEYGCRPVESSPGYSEARARVGAARARIAALKERPHD